MNGRIKKLAVHAGATLEKGYIELSDGQFMLSDNVDLDKPNMDLEKFAELIVVECAMFVVTELEGKVGSRIADATANRLEEHFGVE